MAEVLRKTTKEAKDMISRVSIVNVDICRALQNDLHEVIFYHMSACIAVLCKAEYCHDSSVCPSRTGTALK